MSSKGPLILAIAVSIISGLFLLFLFLEVTREETDENGCATGGDSNIITVVIIDQSDPFEEADKSAVFYILTEWVGAAERLERLRIVAPRASDPYNPKVVFERCLPQNPDTVNVLFATPSALEGEWNEFQDQLRASVGELLASGVAPSSPLLETLIATAREPIFQASAERKIIMVSDLFQKSEAANFYESIPRNSEDLGSRVVEKPSLRDVDVHIRLAARRGDWTAPTQARVKSFWESWLTESGARVSWR